MATIALMAAGSFLGSTYAPGLAFALGSSTPWIFSGAAGTAGSLAGGFLGRYIDNQWLGQSNHITQVGARLNDLNVQVSTQGKPIPRIYGTIRTAGNVIWAQPIVETAHTSTQGGGGGKGGAGQSSVTSTDYTYAVTLAIAICEGPVDSIVNVWADSELLTKDFLSAHTDNYNAHLGSEDQVADTIMESYDGVGNVPAYRGTAYVVLKDFPLEKFGNRIPNFTFEVQKKLLQEQSLESKIKAIQLIPGASETVYSTTLEAKRTTVNGSVVATTDPSNMHNTTGSADVKMALDQLQATFPNLEWVSLVVCWFADSTDAGTCLIKPRVEYTNTGNIINESYPDAWSVGSFNRSNTPRVLTFGDGSLTYGGTPSDKSVIETLVELKARGLNVLFYPLIFVDTITPVPKPWRGRIIPANATDAANWFTKSNGYNAFIQHYTGLAVGGVNLVDKIDAFAIGSEYIGLTSATFSSGVFPGVTGFVNLASTVKGTLPGGVKTVYAADWSEYHHAAGGWYNMDPLWSSSNLDIVGIDNYMPLTPDLDQSLINYTNITEYWQKGELWDYYYDNRPNIVAGTSNLANNPFTTSSGLSTVSLDLTGFFNHHLIVGQQLTLAGCTGNPGGISNANINGVRTVLTVTDITHITFTAGSVASSTATGGGSSCTIDKPKYLNGYDYAQKNIAYWWTHTHTNPGGGMTAWTSKMKPIWFTEFGFPSVDGCANQPNVFVDPTSSEGYYPRGSRQRVDFHAQKQALEATVDFWDTQTSISGNANLVAQKFVWTWDARPYPAWPNLSTVWSDAPLWVTGHWVQGKLGSASLAAVVADILHKVGITAYDVSQLDDTLDGFIITDIRTARNALNDLTDAYFFDMVESGGVLKFVKRGQASVVTINQDNLAVQGGQQSGSLRDTAKITRAQEIDLPRMITVSGINANNNYETSTQVAQRQSGRAINIVNFSWPLVLSDQVLVNIALKLLYGQWSMRSTYNFVLPPQYAYIEPTDVITITLNNVNHTVRIISSDLRVNGGQSVTALSEAAASYDFYQTPGSGLESAQIPTTVSLTQLSILDLPALPQDNYTDDFISMGAVGLSTKWRGSAVYRSDDGGESGGGTYNLFGNISGQSTIGVAITQLAAAQAYTYDNASTVSVLLTAGTLSSVSQLALLNGSNAAIMGGEVVQFQNAVLTAPNSYTLSGFLRGRLGTEDQISSHAVGEKFVLIDASLLRVTVPISTIGLIRYYKPVSVGNTLGQTAEQSFTYAARQLKPYSPVQIIGVRDVSNNLTITWIRRTRIGGDLRDGVDIPLNEQSEAYQIDILNGSVVVRTIATTTSSATYSAAQQTTDFGSTQSNVVLKIYQMSATVGRGIPGNATV